MPDIVRYAGSSAQELAKQKEVPRSSRRRSRRRTGMGWSHANGLRPSSSSCPRSRGPRKGSITFPRVRYPTSGAGIFEIPSTAGQPEFKPSLEGAIVSHRNVRAWWR